MRQLSGGRTTERWGERLTVEIGSCVGTREDKAVWKKDVTVQRCVAVQERCMYVKRNMQLYVNNIAVWSQRDFQREISQDEVIELPLESVFLYLPSNRNVQPSPHSWSFLHTLVLPGDWPPWQPQSQRDSSAVKERRVSFKWTRIPRTHRPALNGFNSSALFWPSQALHHMTYTQMKLPIT